MYDPDAISEHRKRHVTRLAMATLAFGIIAHVGFVEWRSVTGGQDGISSIRPLSIAGFDLASDFAMYPLAWAVCLLAMLLVPAGAGGGLEVVTPLLVAASTGAVLAALLKAVLLVMWLVSAWLGRPGQLAAAPRGGVVFGDPLTVVGTASRSTMVTDS